MPIYEFCCNDCRHEFEEVFLPNLVRSLDSETIECPVCGSTNVTRILSAGSFRPQGIPKGKGGFKPPKCKSG